MAAMLAFRRYRWYSFGPDGIPPRIIKNLGLSITYSLARFFESFMSVGQVPSEWKSVKVTPSFKERAVIRLLQLPSCFAVLRCTEDHGKNNCECEMLTYLRKHNASSKEQHGFLSRRSTLDNLIETTNDRTIFH